LIAISHIVAVLMTIWLSGSSISLRALADRFGLPSSIKATTPAMYGVAALVLVGIKPQRGSLMPPALLLWSMQRRRWSVLGGALLAGLAATAWLAGMSLAWLGWAATPAGTPTPADFSQCAACHSTQPGQNKIGPSLAGVFGRTSGSVPGYNYSAALKNAHLTWDEQTLDKFLQNPAGLVHGTKMFTSVPDANTRQRVIAYLKSLPPQAHANK